MLRKLLRSFEHVCREYRAALPSAKIASHMWLFTCKLIKIKNQVPQSHWSQVLSSYLWLVATTRAGKVVLDSADVQNLLEEGQEGQRAS